MALGPHAAPSRPCSKMDDNVPDHDRAPSPGRGEISAFQGILEQEAVTAAFSKSDFIGLRSLPSNLGPAFRETARDRRRARIRQQLTSMSLSSVGSAGGSLTSPGAPRALHSTAPMGWAGRGQEVPTRFDPAPVHVFTRYMHLPGEYAERVDLARKSHPSRWTAPQNFVVRSTKPPPRYKMEFRDFPHMADPYSAQEEGEKSEAEISGMLQIQTPMRGGGRPGRGEWAVGMLEEKMAGIERDLGMHFGERLVGVSRDVHGLVVVRVREGGEDGEGKGAGQAAAFMRGWVQTSRWAKELGMTREVASWGSRMPHLGEVWFTLRGPWVRARPALPRDLSERIRRERARAHGREERMETQRQQRADRGLTDIDSVYAPPTSRATLEPAMPSGREPFGGLREFQLSRPALTTFVTGAKQRPSEYMSALPRVRVKRYDRLRRGLPVTPKVQVSDPQVDDEESVTTLETPMPEPSVESKAGSFLEGLKLTK